MHNLEHRLFGENILALLDGGKIRLDTLVGAPSLGETAILTMADDDVPTAHGIMEIVQAGQSGEQMLITTVSGIELRCTPGTLLLHDDGHKFAAYQAGPGMRLRAWEANIVQVVRAVVPVILARPAPVYTVRPLDGAAAIGVGGARTSTSLMVV